MHWILKFPMCCNQWGSLPSSFSKAYFDQCWPCVGHEKPLLLGFLAVLHAYMTRSDPTCHPIDLMAHNMGRIHQFYQQTQVWKCLSLGTSQCDCPTPFRMMFSPDLPHPPTSSSTLRIVHVSWFFEDNSLSTPNSWHGGFAGWTLHPDWGMPITPLPVL